MTKARPPFGCAQGRPPLRSGRRRRLDVARWHRAKGDPDSARAAALEALSIADRAEYRLVQADCHNLLARLAFDSGDKETCRKEAEIAHERAWCDGPGHSYKPALDEADRLLAQL